MTCHAKRTNGIPCKAPAIKGGSVCHTHGGAAPQVQAKARQRLLMAADSVAGRLVEIAKSKKTKPSDAIAACIQILNRAGITVPVEVANADNSAGSGQVLWEEFIQIHRRLSGPEA